MKKLIIIILIATGSLCWAQEPVLIHYNFSFEEEYGKGWNDPNLSNDLMYFIIKLYKSNGDLIYKRIFEKPEFVKNEYGNCLLADTIKNKIKFNENYTAKVNYKFINKITGKSIFQFSIPDSINNVALEIFFDQAKPKDTINSNASEVWFPEYDVIKNPKPALVVKYLITNENVKFMPLWFDYVRLTHRPVYTLKNISNDTIYRLNNNIFSGLWGNLFYHNGENWQPYFFGAMCGESGYKKLSPGGEIELVEAFPIGIPIKLHDGFYRYSVDYLDKNKLEKSAVTYFSLIYSK